MDPTTGPRPEAAEGGFARRTLATAILVVAVTVGASGCGPPTCARPHPAVAWEEWVFGNPDPWPDGGTDRPAHTWTFDSDGDGVEDVVDGATGTVVPAVTVHRASGDLTFTTAEGVVARAQPAGDLDGDGRSEIEISTPDASGNVAFTYVVPGSTPDGSYDPTAAGVLVPGQVPYEFRAGDVDGDGADDYVVSGAGSWILSGREIMAPGPGGTFEGTSTPLPGERIGIVRLTPELDAIVLVRVANEITLWVDGTSIRFTTGNSGIPLPLENPERRYAGLVDGPDGQVWLVAGINGDRATIVARWAWDLQTSCPAPADAPAGIGA
jgi:hypothetical protein